MMRDETLTESHAERRQERFARFVGLALLPLVGLGLSFVDGGCGSVPKRHYYALSYPAEATGASTAPPLHPFRLRVKPFTVALPYNRVQIVYRQSPFEFNYYAFRMWSAKPQHMLRELVARHIQAERLVAEVSQEYTEELPDYELSAEVLGIEEYDSGDVWYGHLEMRFALTRFRDQTVVWTYRFDRKRKVYEKDAVYVVRVISRIVEEELNRVVVGLDGVFAAERGVAPTLAAPPPSGDETPVEGTGGATPTGDDLIVPEAPAPRGAPKGDDDLIVPDDPSTTPPTGGRR